MSNFLYKNIVWSLNKKIGDDLLTLPTTEKQFVRQLEKIAENYYPERKQVDTQNTEFFLNQVALLSAKNKAVNLAKNYFEEYWTSYLKLKNIFGKSFLTFPSISAKTRIECIAELIAKCTQFAVDEQTLSRLTDCAKDIIQPNEKEERYLAHAVELYKINYYCKATLAAARGKQSAAIALAKLLRPTLLTQSFAQNKQYSQAAYESSKLLSVVDCIGNSLTKFDDISANLSTKMFVYANGRNVFDTFVCSRFGNSVAEFQSNTATLNVAMRYFVNGNSEVRKVTLTNRGKTRRKFTVEVVTKRNQADTSYFNLGSALCLSANDERLYVANALVKDCDVAPYYGDSTQNYDFNLESGEQVRFDIVTIYANSTPDVATELDNLCYFGATSCPYYVDSASASVRRTDIDLNLTSHGYTLKKPRRALSQRLNYTYQLGDCDVATFVDNAGNSATLLKGFVFGVGGESVYSVRGGLIDKINEGAFNLEADSLRYDKGKSICIVRHSDCKNYEVQYKNPCKTLFVFPFENKSNVTLRGNQFNVVDGERKYSIVCNTKIDSYTTNALECNDERLRYKLSGNLTAGTCLAVCLSSSETAKLSIKSNVKTPTSTPIVRESLVSTYLNYINDKNTFCLRNYIKRPDGLTVAAICYTNPQFVKRYLVERFKTQQKCYYYDVSGHRKTFENKLAFPLAYAYYRNLVGDDLPKTFMDAVNGVIFYEEFTGRDVCVKALILKKLAQLNTEDKVRYLVEYNSLKKQISNDSKLYAYAQAIGALPLVNPSKARLKDLCNQYDIPKSWYYVSQLENLYGLSISPGKLHVCPSVTAENALEQLALNIDGKRIDTTFTKATVRSMTLNGMQCFQPFCPASLKNVENQLVVRY